MNAAEASAWAGLAASQQRVGWSDDLLGFDCGGQQWVLEVCLPMGSLDANLELARRAAAAPAAAAPAAACRGGRAAWRAPSSSASAERRGAAEDRALALAEEAWGHRRYRGAPDTEFVMALLREIEIARIPAPAPIEQRWTARSTAPMSPAASAAPADVFTWVGIIMYIPPLDDADPASIAGRAAVTRAFGAYTRLLRRVLDRYEGCPPRALALRRRESGADGRDGLVVVPVPHWAKIEVAPGALRREGEQGDGDDALALVGDLVSTAMEFYLPLHFTRFMLTI